MGAPRRYDWKFTPQPPKGGELKMVMQKPFSFLLSAFTSKLALGFLLSAFCFYGCQLNPNMQTQGESYLQGEWQQDSIPGQKALLSYSLYHLRFTCDSF